ncbi:MAG: hypothetical protein O9340_07905 [Cyclobacteriaceae bacterium]|nr:hypothetical protein [Cyclobacteriaceae bacterium]
MEQRDKIEAVLKRAIEDERLTSVQLAFITTIYHLSIMNGFCNPIEVTRKKIMRAAKIKSFATYHKIVADLVTLLYIKYVPSCNPLKYSLIEFVE